MIDLPIGRIRYPKQRIGRQISSMKRSSIDNYIY
jgi:hypothetical protein